MKSLFNVLVLLFSFTAGAMAYAVDGDYTLNAGDRLSISVWNEDALKKEVVILPDGTISFPLAGQLMAKDKTVFQVENEIREKLSNYISDPVVTVTVDVVGGNTIHILGKVTTPGSFSMSQPLDAMQALSLAGGLAQFAKENDIIVLRREGTKQRTIPVYYARIKQGNALESNIMLESGDIIIVP
ncbi:polysaccharide biosynthesis/export family protein [Methylophaga sp.]|jgi:polysaccharide biosynthesis/export protein|uniref:polysaccharide biosynthesis/export family protein n=1 Tax=Methylophaga sp. TaxID=2024840 RepID=UPI0025ECFA2D|nr:polysaccharide biosynthesis/export family protein [Methylophaga sp.]|tara:strand:+ start:6056 stop:6610 length:555 start_codon:yes stop_codon:yes gene_type:complete